MYIMAKMKHSISLIKKLNKALWRHNKAMPNHIEKPPYNDK